MREAVILLTSIVATQARQHHTSPQGDDTGSRIHDFFRLDPRASTGYSTSENPQEFLDRVARAFRVMHATDRESVQLATYRLQDLASCWYTTWEMSRGANVAPATWQEFSEEFLCHYLPINTGRARLDQFLTKEAGGMSVAEYNIRFNSLARFDPTVSGVEISRIQTFALALEERKQKQRADRDRSSSKRGRFSGSFGETSGASKQQSVRKLEDNPGSTPSYVTPFVDTKFGIEPKTIKPFEVATPVGDSVVARRVFSGCTVSNPSTTTDLLELEIVKFDVILGMD
ncbi:uncharacterized protein [Nicotiana sylvestris]|uniref:uncharacterized protein n=1 Tax=Nicotiana sylvestris TaxID=4096 RepID=UPI00388CAF22